MDSFLDRRKELEQMKKDEAEKSRRMADVQHLRDKKNEANANAQSQVCLPNSFFLKLKFCKQARNTSFLFNLSLNFLLLFPFGKRAFVSG